MQKHLFLYAWIFAGLITGIAICLGLIAYMLLTGNPFTEIFSAARPLHGVIGYAAV